MKQSLIIGAAAILSFSTYIPARAQEIPQEVEIVPTFFALNISPNGNYIGPYKGYAAVKDLKTGEIYAYNNATFGLGNCIANNGMAVGDGMVLYQGKYVLPELLKSYSESEISCITPDASRVAGYVKNPDRDNATAYVPYVATLDANGEFTSLELLPYPPLDLFEAAPYLVSAQCISYDGKTIAGQVWDNYGGYCYPIVYKEEAEGWKYYLPSENLFNPDKVEIIQNPYLNEPEYPRATNFMSPIQKGLYENAYQNYVSGSGPEPYLEDFMTPEEFAQYEAAVDAYNEWHDSIEQLFNEYIENYYLILGKSPNFEYNILALHPDGGTLYLNGGPTNQYGVQQSKIYAFSYDGLDHVIEPIDKNQAPHQVLSDGTLLTSPNLMNTPNGYILLPDADEFITLPEYLQSQHPEVALWVEETFPGGTGIVSMSDDKQVISGAFTVTQLSDEYYGTATYNFATYIINFNNAGIEAMLDEPSDGHYNVFSLQGVKMLETKDPSQLNSLSKGLYIINGKKVLIK